MKKVFTSKDEISHLWASQAQNEATNPGRNFFYSGLTIYSYGYHFAIAQIYAKDNNIVFVNSNSYSNTTSGHQQTVKYAINHKTVFEVPFVALNAKYCKDSHIKNIKYYLSEIERFINKHKNARKYSYKGQIESNLNQLQGYVKLFKIRSLLTKAEKELLNISDIDTLFENCDFTRIREKRVKSETAKQKKKLQTNLNAWTGCKIPYKHGKVYLRVKGDNIETSQSANVPIKEAKILYLRIKTGKDIKGFKIGYYTVISLNGDLKIGCHSITRDEMNRIAKELNWDN